MTNRESFTLAAVTLLLGVVLGLWFFWKFLCPKEQPQPVITEIVKWQESKQKIRDSVRYHDKERTRWHDSERVVTRHVDGLSDSAAASCVDSIDKKELCRAWLTLPLVKKELLQADTIISLKNRELILSDSIASKWAEIAVSASKGEKVAKTRLSVAKKGIVGAGVVGLILGLILK